MQRKQPQIQRLLSRKFSRATPGPWRVPPGGPWQVAQLLFLHRPWSPSSLALWCPLAIFFLHTLLLSVLWLDFVVFVIGFCDYQITGFPVHGVNSVAMRLCSKSEEVSFGLWCFGREMWRSCWDLRLAKVSMRALGLGKPFLTLPVLA